MAKKLDIDSLDAELHHLQYSYQQFPDVANRMRVRKEAKATILAWHNTQLKAAIPEKIKDNSELVGEPDKYAEGWNDAIDVQQANLEKL